MFNLFLIILAGTILLGASLHLEKQTTYKGSIEYNKLKYIGGTGAVMSWIGFLILSMLYAL